MSKFEKNGHLGHFDFTPFYCTAVYASEILAHTLFPVLGEPLARDAHRLHPLAPPTDTEQARRSAAGRWRKRAGSRSEGEGGAFVLKKSEDVLLEFTDCTWEKESAFLVGVGRVF